MALHPCCGWSLQKATKGIAIFHIVCLTFGLIGIVFSLGLTTLASVGLDYQTSTSHEIHDISVYNETTEEDQNGDIIKRDGETYINIKLVLKSMLSMGVTTSVLGLFIIVYALVLAVELLKGAKERNVWRCNAWWTLQIAQIPVSIITTPLILSIGLPSNANYLPVLLLSPIGWIINLYFVWVVHAFMKEIRSDHANSRPGAGNIQWTKA